MTEDEIKPGVTYTAENGDRDRTIFRIEGEGDEARVLYTISGPFQFSPFAVPLAEFAAWAVSVKEPEASDAQTIA